MKCFRPVSSCSDEAEKVTEPLRQWIEKSRSDFTEINSPLFSSKVFKYVKSALPVALKLTECLIEAEKAEKNGGMNPIPLASITARNITVEVIEIDPLIEPFEVSGEFPMVPQNRALDQSQQITFPPPYRVPDAQPIGQQDERDTETIDRVQITPSNGDRPDVGSKPARLLALGIVLFQLFSGRDPQLDPGQIIENANSHGGDLALDPFGRCSKSRRTSSMSGADLMSQSLARLQMSSIPQSLLTLVTNLFDCAKTDAKPQEAYDSFDDVRLDLQLMLDSPSRFLEDIQVDVMPSFSLIDKLYGRDEHLASLELSYSRGLKGGCDGVIISGNSGVGKSRLSGHVRNLTQSSNGYFLAGKFDHNQETKPLSIIYSSFDQFCERLLQGSTNHQKQAVVNKLENNIGNHVSTLLKLLPSLQSIFDCFRPRRNTPSNAAISEKRIQYMFCVLLRTLSTELETKITLFFDDLQWADPSSLSFLWSLVVNNKGRGDIFFLACFQDEKVNGDSSVYKWLQSFLKSGALLQSIQLLDLNAEAINQAVSDALRLTPRLTRRLSEVLYHKTRGNPCLFRELLDSLKKEDLIYFSFSPRRWQWDLEKIKNRRISEGVVELMIKKLPTLSDDIQTALKAVSCVGSNIDKSLLGILSKDVGLDLRNIISQAVLMGFIDDAGDKYTFAHDKIHQAVYNTIPPQQRPFDHFRYGLAICAHVMDEGKGDEMLFVAVNLINDGGPAIEADPTRKPTISALNLKAGKRSMDLLDFSSAFKFFGHGIFFLHEDHWKSQYDLSINLFNAAAEAACAMGNLESVRFLSSKVISNAKCYEDKLTVLYLVVKTLREGALYQEAKDYAVEVLKQLGEDVHSLLSDARVDLRMNKTNALLNNMDDDSILGLAETNQKTILLTMKIYLELSFTIHLIQPNEMSAISVRMVQLTLLHGLCSVSPMAFANLGYILVSFGDPIQGHRLGKLSLKLMDKLHATENTAKLISVVHGMISWAIEPFQSIAEVHLTGFRSGQQSGDVYFSSLNYQQYLILSFVSGRHLSIVRNESKSFIEKMMLQSQKSWAYQSQPVYFQTMALINDSKDTRVHNEPNHTPLDEERTLNHAEETKNLDLTFAINIHQLIRAFYFRDNASMANTADLFNQLAPNRRILQMFFIIGTFYEGLVSFCLARRTGQNKWLSRGDEALKSLQNWSQFSLWNFENKAKLLEAEKMSLIGDFDSASRFYDDAIKSARDHKFINEEGIACELAGAFYSERKNCAKSTTMYSRARNCYQKWGATALVSRVEAIMESDSPPNTLPSATTIVNEQTAQHGLSLQKRCRSDET